MKNDQIDMEPFEHCQICDRKWHRICALHNGKIHPEGFICQLCRKQKKRPRTDNKFIAKSEISYFTTSNHLYNLNIFNFRIATLSIKSLY